MEIGLIMQCPVLAQGCPKKWYSYTVFFFNQSEEIVAYLTVKNPEYYYKNIPVQSIEGNQIFQWKYLGVCNKIWLPSP